MFESGQNWELFGYDMRNLGKHLRAAWRDLLWTYDSPVRAHLDEPVMLNTPSGSACYQAGEPIGDTKTDYHAALNLHPHLLGMCVVALVLLADIGHGCT